MNACARTAHTLYADYGLLAKPLIPQQPPRPLSRGRELERGQQAARLVFGAVRVFGKDCHDLGECPLPNPPPRGREQVAAGSGVAGRLKKNARNINGRNFSGSLYCKADGTNAARFFQTTFEPIGRVCRKARTRWVRLQGKWRTRACVPHTPYIGSGLA